MSKDLKNLNYTLFTDYWKNSVLIYAEKYVLRQVEQGFSSFFCPIFGVFTDMDTAYFIICSLKKKSSNIGT